MIPVELLEEGFPGNFIEFIENGQSWLFEKAYWTAQSN